MACLPIGKNSALAHRPASALSTAGVLLGDGPSSKVKTTSPSRRKSYALKCSNPKPGPRCIDFHDACDAERVRIVWTYSSSCGRRDYSCSRSDAFAALFCAQAALVARDIEIAIAQTVATRIRSIRPEGRLWRAGAEIRSRCSVPPLLVSF